MSIDEIILINNKLKPNYKIMHTNEKEIEKWSQNKNNIYAITA